MLKSETDEPDQGMAEVMPVSSGRSLPATVPRVLEDMFWVGRYAERAEDLLRLMLAAHVVIEDFRSRPRTSGGLSLQIITGLVGRLAGRESEDYDDDFRSLLLDHERPGSVAQSLAAMRDALSGVRDQWSSDVWRIFGVVDRAQATLLDNPGSHQMAESAGRMLTGVLSLAGVTANMIRDPGWHMISVGRYVERSQQLRVVLNAITERHGLDVDREVLAAVLTATESSVTHRRRYRDYVRPAGVLDLLLKDPENPRSLAFSIARATENLDALPMSTGSTRPERLLAALATDVEETDVAVLVAIGGADRPNLQAFLDATGAQLDRLAEAVADLHFATGPAPRRFGSLPMLEAVQVRYRVEHRTVYTYDDDVTDSLGIAYLVPRQLPWQQVADYRVEVAPAPGDTATDEDFYGNQLTYFQVVEPHRELVVLGTGEVDVVPPLVEPGRLDQPWDAVLPLQQPGLPGAWLATDLVLPSPAVPTYPGAKEYAADRCCPAARSGRRSPT